MLLDHAKQSATDALKTALNRAIQKPAETTGDLIGNKIAEKIARVSKTSPQNSSETNEKKKKNTWRKIYTSRNRQKFIDDLLFLKY